MSAAAVVQEAARRVAVLRAEPVFGPAPLPCRCGAARHEHAGRRFSGACARTSCARYRRDPIDVLVERALLGAGASLSSDLRQAERLEQAARRRRRSVAASDDEPSWGVSPSDTSSCRAMIGFRERGWGTDRDHVVPLFGRPDPALTEPEGVTVYARDREDKRAAMMGTLIHDGVMRVRRRLYPHRRFEQAVAVDGLDRRGRYDEYDPVLAEVGDTKTAGDWKWDLIGLEGPPASEWEQVGIYALALTRQDLPVRTLRIDYVHRASGKAETFHRPYSEAAALAAVNRLVAVAAGLDAGASLPRDREGPSLDAICRLCPFRSACWRMPQAEVAGRSPESYTVLGAQPEDLAIEFALQTYDAHRADEGKAAAAKKAAKVLLDGIEHGVYGAWTYGVQTAWKSDTARHIAMLLDALSVPENERPSMDVLAVAPKKPQDSVVVRKVRAATRERKARNVTPPVEQPAEATS